MSFSQNKPGIPAKPRSPKLTNDQCNARIHLIDIPGRPGKPFAPGNPSRPLAPGIPGKPGLPGRPKMTNSIIFFKIELYFTRTIFAH